MQEEGQGVNPDEGSSSESCHEAERSDERRTSRGLRGGGLNWVSNKLLKILLYEMQSVKNTNDFKMALDKCTDHSLVKDH